jgi:hypothetical protein
VLSAGLTLGSELGAEPAKLETIDPLTLPAPSLEKELEIPANDQRPKAKIVPLLWSRLARSSDEEQIPIIIELQQPLYWKK